MKKVKKQVIINLFILVCLMVFKSYSVNQSPNYQLEHTAVIAKKNP